MKQKLIIGFSLTMLVFAIFMIARDLFRQSSFTTTTACCTDDFSDLKEIDTTLTGFRKIKTIETGLSGLSGIAITDDLKIFAAGDRLVASFDTTGNRIGNFTTDTVAGCIAVTGNNLYLGFGPKVVKFDTSGNHLADFKSVNSDGYITSIGLFEEYIYAADAINKRVISYSDDGEILQEYGMKDSIKGAPGLVIPSLYFDIAFDGFGGLWLANTGRLHIENYSTSGYMQLQWGKSSTNDEGFSGCCNPAHMAILPNGCFVTYEKGIDKIKLFDPTGTFVCLVAGAGSFRGDADFMLGNLNLVKDIAAGPDGRVYVLDAYNNINIFIEKNT